MTTERQRPRISPLELRLYLAAFFAAVYTLSWRSIGGHAVSEPTPAAPSLTRAPEQRFVWIDSLQLATRPVIVLPAGWQVASDPQPPATQPAPVAPRKRAPRVRTRSS